MKTTTGGDGWAHEGGRAKRTTTHILDNHHKEGQLDAERLLGISRTCDVCSGHVGARDLEHAGLNIGVCDPLDMTVAYCGRTQK